MDMDIKAYWQAALCQEAETMRGYFDPQAVIRWPNTNEQFTLEEFIIANCEYPGDWMGEVQRIETIGDQIITITLVQSRDQTVSLHAVSFFLLKEGKITLLEEYWSEDGPPPEWRQAKQIGRPISNIR